MDNERPWVVVTNIGLASALEVGQPLGALIKLTNVGKTPAFEARLASTFKLSPVPPTEAERAQNHVDRPQPIGNVTIGAGNTALSPARFYSDDSTDKFSQRDFDRMHEGKRIVELFGTAFYKDTHGTQHTTDFCWFISSVSTDTFLPEQPERHK